MRRLGWISLLCFVAAIGNAQITPPPHGGGGGGVSQVNVSGGLLQKSGTTNVTITLTTQSVVNAVGSAMPTSNWNFAYAWVAANSNQIETWALYPAITNLLPASSNVFDLGSISKPWRDIYVSTNSIHFVGGPTPIDLSASDVASLKGEVPPEDLKAAMVLPR